MPDFQVSLIDTVSSEVDINIDSSCAILTIEDNSNYVASTESGHLEADFDRYRKIIITRPDGTTYTLSSIGDGDASISSGDSGSHSFNYTLLTTDDDGVWAAALYSLPTWDSGATYEVGDQVTFQVGGVDKFYEAIDGNTNMQPDTSTSDWKEVTEITGFKNKYCVTEKVSIKCVNLLKCYENLVHDANCVIHQDFCNPDILCKNKKFLDAIKLRMLLDGITYATNNKQFADAEKDFNNAKKICNC